MTDKEKIKAKIEEIIEESRKATGDMESLHPKMFLAGKINALQELLIFINSLYTPERDVEKIMAEIEEKARAFAEAHKGETSEEMLHVMRGEFLDDIDWENRRYQIATTILPYCAETARTILMTGQGIGERYKDKTIPEAVAISALGYADALIAELQGPREPQ